MEVGVIAGGDPLLVGMTRVALENGLGTLMFVVGSTSILVGLALMIFSNGEGRFGHYGNGFLFAGLGLSMYPTLNMLAYGLTDGQLEGVPVWVLILPAIFGPLVGLSAAWWSFREARKLANDNARWNVRRRKG